MKIANPDSLVQQIPPHKLPPVEQWNPPLSGDMDIRITRDGTWYHEGRVIQREKLVRLFASILRRDEDGDYYLVTPVEKWRIQVETAPFLAPFLELIDNGKQQILRFQTNLGDIADAGPEHAIEVDYDDDQPTPFIHIRGRLRALISRSVFLELADYAEQGEYDGTACFGVWSQSVFFPLGPIED